MKKQVSINSFFSKFIKFLSSIQLAVISILFLAVLTSIGTIVESKFDAMTAAKLVYKTGWMYFSLGLLALNLLMVMVNRWPWKKRHAPFVLAHIGILILLLGSWVTAKYGLDGSMRIDIGGMNKFVTIPDTEIKVWSSFDGDQYSKIFDQSVDFFLNRPEKYPIELPLGEKTLKVIKYVPYALADSKIVEVRPSKKSTAENQNSAAPVSPSSVAQNSSDGAMAQASGQSVLNLRGRAIRVQLKNSNVNMVQWLYQRRNQEQAQLDLGPALLQLGGAFQSGLDRNYIYFNPIDDKKIQYRLISKKYPEQKGTLHEGDTIQTPWMGIEVRIISYYSMAEEQTEVKELARPTEISTSAIQIQWGEQLYWLQLNDIVKIFTPTAVHLVSYANKRIDLGFNIILKKFDMGLYQGTQRAASYASLVQLEDKSEHLISMNEPLKQNGLTFYQASFQNDESGKPVASVLSVNQDPGRWIKYLGSLILSFGVVLLFWYRRQQAQTQFLGASSKP